MDRAEPKTVLFTAAHTFSLTRSWPVLMRELMRRGWRVAVAAPDERGAQTLRELGCDFVPVPFTRELLQPVADVRALVLLRGAVRRLRPRLVHAVHAKPMVTSAIALVGNRDTKLVCTVAGLGRLADDTDPPPRALRRLLWAAHLRADRMVFQKESDRASLAKLGGRLEAKSTVVPEGSGVDLETFKPPAQRERSGIRVFMASRLIAEKGVLDYIEAARILRGRGSEATFVLAGEPDRSHPGTVDDATLERAHADGLIDYVGHVDAERIFAETDIAVLPSYYGEGIPRFLLEAAATGIPVVTTDVPGCRDAVDPERTGLVVPPRDPRSLAAAIERLANDRDLRSSFGSAGRKLVEHSFDARHVASQYLDVYASLGLEVDRGGGAGEGSPAPA